MVWETSILAFLMRKTLIGRHRKHHAPMFPSPCTDQLLRLPHTSRRTPNLPFLMRHNSRIFIALATFVCLNPNRSNAQIYTWSAPGGGSWTNGTNWGSTSADYPNGSGDRAVLSALGNGSAKTITLDGA